MKESVDFQIKLKEKMDLLFAKHDDLEFNVRVATLSLQGIAPRRPEYLEYMVQPVENRPPVMAKPGYLGGPFNP
jgi:hypothetical protein